MIVEELYTRLGFQVDPSGIEKGKRALSGFKKFIGGLALGAGFAALAKAGVSAAMTMEGITAQFKVMTGSAERADAVIKEIAEFAKATPFTKLGLSDAAKTLMAFGLESEKVVPTLKMLGDVAGADQNRLNSLALVFGQIQSTGKLMGQDLLQLINQGFNPLTIISKKTGISMSDLKDAMAQGAISADMVTEAFKAATSEGGLFFGNLDAQSKTLQGRLSTLKDNVETALQNMAEAFLPLMKAAADAAIAFDWTPVVDKVRDVAEALRSLPLSAVAKAVEWLGIVFVGVATRDIQGVFIATLEGGLQRASDAMYHLGDNFTGFRNLVVGGAKTIGKAFIAAFGPIGTALLAIEGIKTAYEWFQARQVEKATEAQKAQARGYVAQREATGATLEQIMAEEVGQQEARKKRVEALRGVASQGGEAGRQASAEIDRLTSTISQRASFVAALKAVYQERTSMEYRPAVSAASASTPSMASEASRELDRSFADIKKAIEDGARATNKNTKAVDRNTKAQGQFDMASLSRQAFDANFNIKLKSLLLGA